MSKFVNAWVRHAMSLPLPPRLRRLLVALVVRPVSWYIGGRLWLHFELGFPEPGFLVQHRDRVIRERAQAARLG